jgi:uracil-DNA glycosylase family 4
MNQGEMPELWKYPEQKELAACQGQEIGPACTKCPLWEKAMHPWQSGQGHIPCQFMVITDAPMYSRQDKITGPMQGLLLKRMKDYLAIVQLDIGQAFCTTALHCRPPDGVINTAPIRACADHTLQEIKAVKPQFVLLVGSTPLKQLFPKGGTITNVHGTVMERADLPGVKFLPTFNPMVLDRDITKEALFRMDLNKFAAMVKGQEQMKHQLNMVVINTDDAFQLMLQDIEASQAVAVDIECSDLNPYAPGGQVFCLGLATPQAQWILPLEYPGSPWQGQHMLQKLAIEIVAEALQGKKVAGHNFKFDNKWLMHVYGTRLPLTFDTMLAHHLLDENRQKGLKYLAKLYLNAPDYDISKESKQGKADVRQLFTYCAWDVYFTLLLYERFRVELAAQPDLARIFMHHTMKASHALEKVEARGVYINVEKYQQLSQELKERVKGLKEKLDALMPGVNWNSPMQVGKLLFGKKAEGGLGLTVIEFTDKGAPSTGEKVLKQLQGQHPVVDLLLDFRKYDKLLGTYVEGWAKYIMPDHRMYPNFNIAGTVTGRLSCDNPNLQQVPRPIPGDTINLKSVVTAPPGWVLVEVDFSQIELRIAAWIANERNMLQVFREGKVDIHSKTAQILTGKTEVSKKERQDAKPVNFGFLYGMGAKTFQDYAFTDYGVKITLEQAQEFRDKYFQAYPGLVAYHQRQRNTVRMYHQIITPLGRIRRLPDIASRDEGKAAMAERQAINTPVQSFASDLALASLIQLTDELDESQARIVGTVHDSILFEIRQDCVEQVVPQIQAVMCSPRAIKEIFGVNITVPILAEASIKPNGWGT